MNVLALEDSSQKTAENGSKKERREQGNVSFTGGLGLGSKAAGFISREKQRSGSFGAFGVSSCRHSTGVGLEEGQAEKR